MKKTKGIEIVVCDDCGIEMEGYWHECCSCGNDICGNCVGAIIHKVEPRGLLSPYDVSSLGYVLCKTCLQKVVKFINSHKSNAKEMINIH